jgi:enoyl-CoA hydratase
MATQLVEVDRDGPVAICRLNRPPANAIEIEFTQQLEAVLTELMTDTDVGALVLTGTGRFFSGGLDLKVVPHYGAAEQRQLINSINRMVARLYGCPLPIVAAVNGHAVAGGLILVLTCDYRVGTTVPCKLGLTEARVGIPFPAGPMAVLKAELAPPAVRLLTLEADNRGPEAARAMGILDDLAPPDQLLARAIEKAKDLASIPQEAYGRIKRQLRGDTVSTIEKIVAQGSDPMLESWINEAAPEAAASVLRGPKTG